MDVGLVAGCGAVGLAAVSLISLHITLVAVRC